MKTIIFLLTLLIVPTAFIFCQSIKDLSSKAVAASDKGNNELALKYINQAIILDSMNGELYEKKGDLLFKIKKDQEAVDAYSKGISVQSDLVPLYIGRGLIYLANQFIEESISDFNSALKFTNNDSVMNSIYVNRAVAKCWKQDYEGAYKDLISAYNRDTTQKIILANLSNVCQHINKPDEALKYLLTAYAYLPNNVGVMLDLGFYYQTQFDYKKSTEYYNKAIKLDPKLGIGYSNRSYNRLKLGDTEGAMKDINTSIELYPANSYAYRNRGLIWLELKKYASACDDFNIAIKKGYTQMYGKDVEELIQKNCSLFKN